MIFGELAGDLLVELSAKWPKSRQIGRAILMVIAAVALVVWLIWG